MERQDDLFFFFFLILPGLVVKEHPLDSHLHVVIQALNWARHWHVNRDFLEDSNWDWVDETIFVENYFVERCRELTVDNTNNLVLDLTDDLGFEHPLDNFGKLCKEWPADMDVAMVFVYYKLGVNCRYGV